jgi:hypothetical protein
MTNFKTDAHRQAQTYSRKGVSDMRQIPLKVKSIMYLTKLEGFEGFYRTRPKGKPSRHVRSILLMILFT